MTDRLTARQFQESEDAVGWRALARGATAVFRTGSFPRGAALVERIGALADEANHHPDVDLRRSAVAVRVFSHDVQGLSERDLDLARRISLAAVELGLGADPGAAQEIDLTIDALDIPAVRPFWAAVLGHELVGDEDAIDPQHRWPGIWFQQMDAPRPLRNRIHLDVFLPRGRRAVHQEAALAAGGRVANDEFAPSWWTLADPEGNEVDVEDWEGFDDDVQPPLLSPDAFGQADGVEDWSFLQGASTHYLTGGLAKGVALASAAASLADDLDLPLYADLRYAGTSLRVGTPEDGWTDDRFLALCQGVQVAARGLGLVAEPNAVRDVQVTFDALDIPAVQEFWAAALGYLKREDTDLYDPLMRGPSVFIQQLDAPREQRNRIHLDVFVPDDAIPARIEAALAAGGHLVTDAHAPFWWTLADPEGNEVDIATTVGRREAWDEGWRP